MTEISNLIRAIKEYKGNVTGTYIPSAGVELDKAILEAELLLTKINEYHFKQGDANFSKVALSYLEKVKSLNNAKESRIIIVDCTETTK